MHVKKSFTLVKQSPCELKTKLAKFDFLGISGSTYKGAFLIDWFDFDFWYFNAIFSYIMATDQF